MTGAGFELTFSLFTGLISVFLAAAASAIIFELNRDKETALRRFHLNQEESVMDFRLFMYVNLAMTAGFVLFWLGSVTDVSALRSIPTYSMALYGVFLTLLFTRWWRRF